MKAYSQDLRQRVLRAVDQGHTQAEIAKRGLSQRWLTQTTVREEVFSDSQGQEKRRMLVRATAHNEWRVIQQLLKYGDQAELVEPAHLREQMRQAVIRMMSFYEKKDTP